jgi:hypothetical protein
MGLGNVVVMISAAQGSVALFVLGLVAFLPDEWPILMVAGAVLLGWVAGQMVASDALIGDWIARET